MNFKNILKARKNLLFLATSISLLSGCSDKHNQDFLFKDTMFENSVICNIDGYVSIFRVGSDSFEKGRYDYVDYVYYQDIISGEFFTGDGHLETGRKFYNIEVLGNVIEYLTDEQIKSIATKELTDNQIAEIFIQIRSAILNEKETQK